MLAVKFDKTKNEFYLIDGDSIIDCKITEAVGQYINNQRALTISFHDSQTFELVLYNAADLTDRVVAFQINSYVNWNGINLSVEIRRDEEWWGDFLISFNNDWKHSFTTEEYLTEFARIQGNGVLEIDFEGEPGKWEGVQVYSSSENNTLTPDELLYRAFKIISAYHHEAIIRLTYTEETQLKFTFDFPDEIKFSCEQYLLYFVQFVRDLGINATSTLKENAGKVLFSVTPTNDNEALDKIREALAIYLNFPSNPIVYDESFASMRLAQQIENFQHSQKMAAREVQLAQRLIESQDKIISEKDFIISQKDFVIEHQQKIIEKITSKSIMVDSLENKEELEEFFDGFKVGKSKFLMEQLGVHLNPVTVLKTIGKKFLGKDDYKKSILGLDDETE